MICFPNFLKSVREDSEGVGASDALACIDGCSALR